MARYRSVWTQNGRNLVDENGNPAPIRVTEDWQDTTGRRNLEAPVTDLYMDGVRATDGTDIGSRAKRREYMRLHGLVDCDDYKQTWADAQKQRDAVRAGQHDTREIRDAVGRALYQRRNGRR